MKRFSFDFPRTVKIALAVIAIAILGYAALLPTLGSARDDAIAANARLLTEQQQAQTSIAQAQTDHTYVTDNLGTYEALIKSDSLIPHTRRAAIVELQRIAEIHGLTALDYSFAAALDPTSPQAAQTQPASAAYRVSVEQLVLRVGAPLDGDIYRFMADVATDFPGAAVLESVSVARAPEITDAALKALASGEDSKLVEADIKFLWRTAQAREQDKVSGAAK